MRKREVRIEFDRLIVKIDRCLEILQQIVRSRLIIARAQIENVRVGVGCRLSFDARFFLRRKRRLQGVGDAFRDLCFYSEDVGQLPVVTLRPQMRVVVGADQLHVDVHAIFSLLHTAFEHIGHVQLFCDLRQIFRSAVVARGGSARDHAQAADSRECSDDFILNALREKRVLLIRAQILEREHSN